MPRTKRANKIVALDWDARTLRVVHASLKKRGVVVHPLVSAKIPADVDADDPQQMGKLINEVLSRAGIRTKHAIVDVPRDQAILNTLHLPRVGREELPGMVQIQMAKELPFPLSDAVIDFAIDPRPAEGPTQEVLVAAVQNEIVDKFKAITHAAGLKLERIGLRPYANMVAARALLQPAMPERVLMVDIRPTLAEIDVLRDGHIAFSRAASVSVPEGVSDRPTLSFRSSDSGEDSQDDGPGFYNLESVVDALIIDITRSIEAYRSSDPALTKMDLAVVAGDTGVEEALAEAIQKRLKVEAQVYDPASSFGWDPDEHAESSGFSASLGLVLSQVDGDGVHFDFLHPKRETSVARERLRRAPLVAAVALVFLVAGVTAVMAFTKEDRETIARLQAAVRKFEAREGDNEDFMKTFAKVRDFDRDQVIWVDALHDLIKALPPNQELVVEKITMNQDSRRIALFTRGKEHTTAVKAREQLMNYKRPGDAEPRFARVDVGAQKESPGDKYPFSQTIEVLVELHPEPVSATKDAPREPDETESTPSR